MSGLLMSLNRKENLKRKNMVARKISNIPLKYALIDQSTAGYVRAYCDELDSIDRATNMIKSEKD